MSQTMTTRAHDKPIMSTTKPAQALSQQYGGLHAGSWVDLLPASWIPYVQLSRLSPPVGFFLIVFPHLFGVMHAACVHGHGGIEHAARVSLLLVGGSFFCNNASHAWNDLVDAPIDAQIARTKMRPIPRGAISRRAALVFAISQAVGAAVSLLGLPHDTGFVVLPNVLATAYYPFAKRHTHLAQLVLGVCLTWGVMVGSSAMGVDQPWRDPSTVWLLVGSILWVVIFDTIYAHQDLADDIRVGVKSTAVLFGSLARAMLWFLGGGMVAALTASGYYGHMGPAYYALTVGGCAVSVGAMLAKVDLGDPASCWMWFSQGFWATGAAIASGLLVEFGLQSCGDVVNLAQMGKDFWMSL
ncbi:UbiA prenyltransferase family-domain-containing protein [Podospora appendiculata]|uniref:4-hydroxybenzoate polyprenyltransferase, mitochondrial n=1 Tax=Podospora appendiculata TaxID=314037 RepID=A0AAE1CA55_9PEZI|nr:UbiA prenyltransferase family-domain-containing protein [Podospora appendiculata]